jgi:hypothetical protein
MEIVGEGGNFEFTPFGGSSTPEPFLERYISMLRGKKWRKVNPGAATPAFFISTFNISLPYAV